MKAGHDLPSRIQNAPSLLPGLELYYLGFMDLMSSRIVGMGISPIWWDLVEYYCQRKDLDAEQTDSMHYHIGAMDSVYMKHMSKK